jgi:hypothetical protein
VLRTHLVRSDLRTTSLARSSDLAVWTNTKDASRTAILVPMPMLVFDLNSAGSIAFAGSMPVQRAIPNSSVYPLAAPGSDIGTAVTPLVERLPSEPAAALSEVPDVNEPPKPFKPKLQPPVEAHRVELIIDSLAKHELIETIPVTVEALGDKVFTATVHALNLAGTGNTIGDALIIVKDQIDVLYNELTNTSKIDEDGKKYLKYLQSHIKISSSGDSRSPRKSLWR